MPEITRTIDYRWGRRLKGWLRRNEVFRILDRQGPSDAELCDWTGGGCRLLAETLLPILEGQFPDYSFALKTLGSEDCPAEHVVVEARSPQGALRYIDGDGVTIKKTLLRRIEAEAGQELRVIDYDSDELDSWEIQSPPIKRALLARAIEEALRGGKL